MGTSAMESMMLGKWLALLSVLFFFPCVAAAQSLDGGSKDTGPQDAISRGRPDTGGQSYGDRNRGGRSGFYSYPSHRHVDDGGSALFDSRLASRGSEGTSRPYRATHGSAYYGPNYGAPYFGGGYYDRGVYYRERRD